MNNTPLTPGQKKKLWRNIGLILLIPVGIIILLSLNDIIEVFTKWVTNLF